MKRILCFLITVSVILITPLLAQSNDPAYISGQVIVKFHRHIVDNPSFKVTNQGTKATTGISSIDKISKAIGVTEILDLIPSETKEMVLTAASSRSAATRSAVLEDKYGLQRTYIVKISTDVAEAVKQFMSNPEVEYAGPNHWVEATTTPNDPSYSTQWNLPKIYAPDGWNISTGSSNVLIGIIDSGVDLLHPDLIANLYQGYDFVRQDPDAMRADGYTLFADEDYTVADDNPMDFNGHGTCVAGTAGAVSNNGTGVAGIMWNCKIIPLRTGASVIPPGGGSDPIVRHLESDIAFAINWSCGWGVHVINMSFSSWYQLPTVEAAINNGHDTWGMVFVAAAGNTGYNEIRYPAGYSNVIAVTGSSMDDLKHPDATYGANVSVGAPYTSYNTAYDHLDQRQPNGLVHDYVWWAGTSLAAPLVSGLAGLILAVNPSLARSNPEQVRSLIINNSDKVGGYNYNWDPNRPGHSIELGYGRINVYRTLSATQSLRRLPAEQSSEISTVEKSSRLSLENFPDPFNPTTKIQFSLPEDGMTRLIVFDLLGREVSTLVTGNLKAGSHIVEFDGAGLSSGVYLCRLEFGSQVISRKMLLQK